MTETLVASNQQALVVALMQALEGGARGTERARFFHPEVTQIEFDPEQISYEDLLARFWEMHDPTQVNRQGPDVGDQYRSVIFFHSPEQEAAARASKERVQQHYRKPIATSIEPTTGFWRAEEYHQCYLEKRGQQGGLAGMMRSVLGS